MAQRMGVDPLCRYSTDIFVIALLIYDIIIGINIYDIIIGINEKVPISI